MQIKTILMAQIGANLTAIIGLVYNAACPAQQRATPSLSTTAFSRFMTKKSPRFEDSLLELEQLVERLEQGDISLEDSLKAFERGVQLTRVCQKALKEAEQKIQVLLEEEGQIQLKPFTANAHGD